MRSRTQERLRDEKLVESSSPEGKLAPALEAVSNPKYTIPEPRAVVLRRQRLLDFLNENIDHPLQLVSAPAGYGKTTLLADFARDTDLTICWYAVDELDRDPGSFLRHLVESIRSRFVSFADWPGLDRVQSTDAAEDWQAFVPTLVRGIAERIPEYFLLVIDDFHILAGVSGVTEAVDLLVQRMPDNCRLIIASREVPALPSPPSLDSSVREKSPGWATVS